METRMRLGFSNPKQTRLRPVRLAVAALAALIAAQGHAAARGGSERAIESIETRAAGQPIVAVVSLQRQRITVYDSSGWILRAPVSSGQKGRETPAGIFSVIQKEAEHYSNLYDDAFMPHMQRLTWSGIALHGGVVPGHPASHGCIRLPFEFAEHLFDLTRPGLRVIVAPTDAAPVEITHPLLFQPKPGAAALAAARKAEADEATRKSDQTRLAAGTAYREAMQAMVPVRTAENLKARAEVQLAAAETALGAATSTEAKQQAEDAKAAAMARVAELQDKWAAAKAELQPKQDALAAARDAAGAAETVRTSAIEAARQAARELEPVSVLISRKTQRLYVRQAFEPVFDAPITIQDADRPVGTHVFTAMERGSDDANIRWSVVSLEGSHAQGGAIEKHGAASGSGRRDAVPASTESASARAALDRIVIPQDVQDRIPGIAPRSSLIVTDEAPSSETGKGTDFVVVLSDEPQGGIKFRRREPMMEYGFARSRPFVWGSPFRAPFSTW
jgi:L,D-transpeptidase catalytic domain